MNDPDGGFQNGEGASFSCFASAEGLAKCAAFMANKGTFQGHQLISEATWDAFHDGIDVKIEAMGLMRWVYNQGGAAVHKKEERDKLPWDDKLMDKGGMSSLVEDTGAENNEGWIGWMGMGGSNMKWHPELKISIGYTCSRLIWLDFNCLKATEFQKIAVDITKDIMDKNEGVWTPNT